MGLPKLPVPAQANPPTCTTSLCPSSPITRVGSRRPSRSPVPRHPAWWSCFTLNLGTWAGDLPCRMMWEHRRLDVEPLSLQCRSSAHNPHSPAPLSLTDPPLYKPSTSRHQTHPPIHLRLAHPPLPGPDAAAAAAARSRPPQRPSSHPLAPPSCTCHPR